MEPLITALGTLSPWVFCLFEGRIYDNVLGNNGGVAVNVGG